MSTLLDLTPFLLAFKTDMVGGDRTTTDLGLNNVAMQANIVLRQSATLAGIELITRLPKALDLEIAVECFVKDGQTAASKTSVARLHGRAGDILALERTLLNGLQILSGIATTTATWVAALPKNVYLLDTRKTTPGLAAWQKYAFHMGGGINHRLTLADVVLIKDNHIALLGSVGKAVELALNKTNSAAAIICEVEDLLGAQQAVQAGATTLLIDNAPQETWPNYWNNLPTHIRLEFSGGISYQTLATIATPPRPIWLSSSQPILQAIPIDIGLDVVSE